MLSTGFYILKKKAESYYQIADWPISVSTCISNFIPDAWSISWVTETEHDIIQMKSHGLSAADIKSIQDEATAMNEIKYGWPNTILYLEDAIRLYKHYGKRNGFTLLEAGIAEEDVDLITKKLAPEQPDLTKYAPIGNSGMLDKLLMRANTSLCKFLGFELINTNHEIITCSGFCNGIETYFKKMLNPYSLFDSHEEASMACAKIHSGEIPAESGFWFSVGLHIDNESDIS